MTQHVLPRLSQILNYFLVGYVALELPLPPRTTASDIAGLVKANEGWFYRDIASLTWASWANAKS